MQNEQNIPRPEHPRPQFVRDGWMNLNGTWQFEIDHADSGLASGMIDKERFNSEIVVPFCPESSLSGVGCKDFMRAVWYRRTFLLPREALDKRVFLHFGAADYECSAYVNGQAVGQNEGGYHSFTFEITRALKPGENALVVCCRDDTRSPLQPTGKQSKAYASHGCCYTRTTGIWQTVWLEWTNQRYIRSLRYTPDAAAETLHIRAEIENGAGCEFVAEASYAGVPAGCGKARVHTHIIEMTLPISGEHFWNVGEPNLYDLRLTLLKDNETIDALDSYFGLRSVGFDGMRFLINGKPVFQRLILDQGFYPDGIYTAPTDEALKHDIELSMQMGFNGARLHEKVFEARYLYHADHLGYLCWGEMANWGLDHADDGALASFMRDWLPAVARDISAPCIVGWCPFNETWDNASGTKQNDELLRTVYRITKALDPSRPCIDTSGNFHVETDIFDVHDYEQNPDAFANSYKVGTTPITDRFSARQRYAGQPVFVSEYGGIWWSDKDGAGWGYGERPESREAFLERFRGLTDTLLDNPDHFGFCYTQLTDVEQEQNGLYTYARKPKFPPQVIRAIVSRQAACERNGGEPT